MYTQISFNCCFIDPCKFCYFGQIWSETSTPRPSQPTCDWIINSLVSDDKRSTDVLKSCSAAQDKYVNLLLLLLLLLLTFFPSSGTSIYHSITSPLKISSHPHENQKLPIILLTCSLPLSYFIIVFFPVYLLFFMCLWLSVCFLQFCSASGYYF